MVAVACAHADAQVNTIAAAAKPNILPCGRAVTEDLRAMKTISVESGFSRTDLVDGLSGSLAPRETILRPLQRDQPDAVVGGVASRRAGDDHLVAGLERSARYAGAAELAGPAPLDVVDGRRAVLLLHVHVHEGMRIPEDELHDLTFDRDRLRLEVGRREGVVRERGAGTRPRGRDQESYQATLHGCTSFRSEVLQTYSARARSLSTHVDTGC